MLKKKKAQSLSLLVFKLPHFLVSQSETAFSEGGRGKKSLLDLAQNRSTAGICLGLGRVPFI